MENNKLVLVENDEEVEYRVVLNIEDVNGKDYVVYTKDEKNEDGDIITYVGEYKLEDDNSSVKIISIKDDKEWEFIRDIINSLDLMKDGKKVKNGKKEN